MGDKVSKETRSQMMRSIRSISKLEDYVCKELWSRGLRFRRNSKTLFGKPDISIKKYKIVIFIDSCFWHYCDIHGRYPKSNIDYWEPKIRRNKNRDIAVTDHYINMGWNVLRIWEHEFKDDFDSTINKIIKFINCHKQNMKHNN